jgi:hypothetical protein
VQCPFASAILLDDRAGRDLALVNLTATELNAHLHLDVLRAPSTVPMTPTSTTPTPTPTSTATSTTVAVAAAAGEPQPRPNTTQRQPTVPVPVRERERVPGMLDASGGAELVCALQCFDPQSGSWATLAQPWCV